MRVSDDSSAHQQGRLRLNAIVARRVSRSYNYPGAALALTLFLFCPMLLLICRAHAPVARAQSNQSNSNQNQQTRPRTVRENKQAPVNTNSVEKSDKMLEAREKMKEYAAPVNFYDALEKYLKKRKLKLENICPATDNVARRVLEDYGAIYVASSKVMLPPLCFFAGEAEVEEFQNRAKFEAATIGEDEIELQPAALKALLSAREQANKEGLDITPRDGAEAARRTYEDTLRLWDTRFLPALDYWSAKGRLTPAQVARLRALPLRQQISEVLELEKSGIFFSKDFSKSILYSIAAPGASQHISMLAFDVNEFMQARVREILAEHGWFQTVLSDLPHFTYLGLAEKELPKRGLRPVMSGEQLFWIPNV